jgi:hypothetical protein
MLKSRNLIILAVVLAVLAAISLVQTSSHRKSTSQPATTRVLGADFATEDLQRIEVGFAEQNSALVLEKLPSGWVVRTAHSHQANQQRVDNLLSSLGELTGEFRSDSAEVLPDYGFSDSTVVSINAFGPEGSEPVFQLEVGKKPERAVGNFVKRPGSNAVYLTSKSILSSLGLYSGPGLPQAKHFLDLEVHKVERTEVDALTIKDGGSLLAMHKEFTEPEPVIAEGDSVPTIPPIDRNVYEWKLTEPNNKTALKTKADGVLSAVANMRAVDIDDPTADLANYGLADPQKSVTVTMQDGQETVLTFGNMREAEDDRPAGYYLQVDDEETVWVVNEYLLNNIFKKVEDLLPTDE